MSLEKKWRETRDMLIAPYLVFGFMGLPIAALNGFSVQAASELFIGVGTSCLAGLAVLFAERPLHS